MPIACSLATAIIPSQPPTSGGSTLVGFALFNSPVVNILGVALSGFSLAFVDGDRHIKAVEVVTPGGTQISSTGVNVQFNIAFADENFDDPFTGFVQALVIAEVA